MKKTAQIIVVAIVMLLPVSSFAQLGINWKNVADDGTIDTLIGGYYGWIVEYSNQGTDSIPTDFEAIIKVRGTGIVDTFDCILPGGANAGVYLQPGDTMTDFIVEILPATSALYPEGHNTIVIWPFNAPGYYAVDSLVKEIHYEKSKGIEDVDHNVQPYPNPASTLINIDSKFIGAGVTIYSSEGKLVKRIDKLADPFVDLKNLNSGLFFIEIRSNSKRHTGTFIKN